MPKVKRHTKSTHANSTLATDGTRLIAMLGSEGLYAFDMNGKELWTKDFGVLDSGFYMAPAAQWEFASSPVIHDGKLVIQADVQKRLVRRGVRRGDRQGTLAHAAAGRADLEHADDPSRRRQAADCRERLEAHGRLRPRDRQGNLEAERRRRHSGAGAGHRSRPRVHHERARTRRRPIYAIRETATGDISLAAGATTNEHIAWSVPRDGAYLISPVLYRDLLYVTKSNGVFNAFDAKTGETRVPAASRQRHHGVHGVHDCRRRQGLLHERRRRRVRGEGRARIRAAGHESARRHHDGEAGGVGGSAVLPDEQQTHRCQINRLGT